MPILSIHIAKTTIQFNTKGSQLFELLSAVFAPHVVADTAVSHINISLHHTADLPQNPKTYAFEDSEVGFGLTYFAKGVRFFFEVGAFFEVNFERFEINGRVSPPALSTIEDLIYICLAPLLRRRGAYLVHGFAAQKGNETMLLVGASGSGKTTAGLCLLLSGWRLLSNDTVLLVPNDEQIVVHPLLDMVRIRRGTIDLLEPLRTAGIEERPYLSPDLLTRMKFQAGKAGAITAVYFPVVKPNKATKRIPLSKAMALAFLLEASLDVWDRSVTEKTVRLFEQVGKQTAVYQLHCGRDVTSLTNIIGQTPA